MSTTTGYFRDESKFAGRISLAYNVVPSDAFTCRISVGRMSYSSVARVSLSRNVAISTPAELSKFRLEGSVRFEYVSVKYSHEGLIEIECTPGIFVIRVRAEPSRRTE